MTTKARTTDKRGWTRMKNQFLIRVNLCPSVIEKCTTRGLAWRGPPIYSEESRLNGGISFTCFTSWLHVKIRFLMGALDCPTTLPSKVKPIQMIGLQTTVNCAVFLAPEIQFCLISLHYQGVHFVQVINALFKFFST